MEVLALSMAVSPLLVEVVMLVASVVVSVVARVVCGPCDMSNACDYFVPAPRCG